MSLSSAMSGSFEAQCDGQTWHKPLRCAIDMLASGNSGDDRPGAMQARWRRWRDAAASLAAATALTRDPLRRDRSDGIDVLRALFALWVVLAHLIPWSVAAQGPAAVPAWLATGARLIGQLFQ